MTNSEKTVLVTGGAGFLGNKLSLNLCQLGFKVKILDNISAQIHGKKDIEQLRQEYKKNDIEFIYGDVRQGRVLKSSIGDVKYVIHLASETGTGQSMYEVSKYFHSNVVGAATLFEFLQKRRHKVEKVFYASSRAVYGEGEYLCDEHGISSLRVRPPVGILKCEICSSSLKPVASREDSQLNPVSQYGVTKMTMEYIAKIFQESTGIPTIGLRYQNIYGPGQSLRNPYTGVVSIFSQMIRRQEQFVLFEDGEPSRDFIFIDDAVKMTLQLLSRENLEDIYNIGSGVRVSLNELISIIENVTKKKALFKSTKKARKGDVKHALADMSRFDSTLGLPRLTGINQGIEFLVQWMNEEITSDSFNLYLKSIRVSK
jgi:dTDP-L-rhamnose 4-epimerase